MNEQEYLALSDTAKNTIIAERLMGLKVITDNEECSQFTRGAVWQGGSDCYGVDVTYAVPAEVEDTDGWLSEHIDEQAYLANYCGDLLAAWRVMEKALQEADPGAFAMKLLYLVKNSVPDLYYIGTRELFTVQVLRHLTPPNICMAALQAKGFIT